SCLAGLRAGRRRGRRPDPGAPAVPLSASYSPSGVRGTMVVVRPCPPSGIGRMTITVEATYENGVLRPSQPLPLKEHEKVRVTVETKANWVEATYGILRWSGDPEELRRLALSPTDDLEDEES